MTDDLLEDEFGDIIAKARFGRGQSAAAAAAAAGISAADLAALEGCERAPSRDESDGLAAALALEPACLWAIARDAWSPAPVALDDGATRITTIPYPPMRVIQYVVGDLASGQALVVDPGAEPERILAALADQTWSAAAIVVTHADGDHVGALAAVDRALRVPVWIHPRERDRLDRAGGLDVHTFEHGDRFTAGPFEIEALGTPGHSPGHTSLALRGLVLSGDAIFAGSLGRTSLGPAHYAGHLAAVRERLLTLPPAARLFPGHGPPTTVGEELRHNPFFAGG